MYYNKQGEQITQDEWRILLENDEYKRVGWTELENGKIVSTVWLGLDHAFGGGEPLIFETMVQIDSEWEDQVRYHTLEEAQQGHEKMVKKYSHDDGIALYFAEHPRHPDFCTHIQIGRVRFGRIERLIDAIRFLFIKPKLSEDALEVIELKINKEYDHTTSTAKNRRSGEVVG